MEIIYEKLFIDWELETWANVLEVIGFTLAFLSFIITLFIKSEINKLKTQYIFDKRIKEHIKNLQLVGTNLNQFLNDYDNKKENIRTELSKCQVELEDLIIKLNFRQSLKSRRLILYIIWHKNKPFENRLNYNSTLKQQLIKFPKKFYTTTYDNIWIIYNRALQIRLQVENINKNKQKSL
ncbi:hypothetical protein V1389_03500 [Flavobacterium rakeshii]|uniref:hypothetical protein n=1 Tax=Flavobacterium rakeshii TaxID=1038845 RepID=UPI002E7B132C|nr:hypothetical protein [Flavobacterium rakeshii]MEE1897387.1 hypothetical protein [Flavobacterium rakeshii]